MFLVCYFMVYLVKLDLIYVTECDVCNSTDFPSDEILI